MRRLTRSWCSPSARCRPKPANIIPIVALYLHFAPLLSCWSCQTRPRSPPGRRLQDSAPGQDLKKIICKGELKSILKRNIKGELKYCERDIWTWQAGGPHCVWEGHFCGQSDQGDVMTVQNIVILKCVPEIEVLAALPLSKDSNQGGWWLFQPRRPGLAPTWSHLSNRGTPRKFPKKSAKSTAPQTKRRFSRQVIWVNKIPNWSRIKNLKLFW